MKHKILYNNYFIMLYCIIFNTLISNSLACHNIKLINGNNKMLKKQLNFKISFSPKIKKVEM